MTTKISPAEEASEIDRAIKNLIAAAAALAVVFDDSKLPSKEERAAALLHIGIAINAIQNSDPAGEASRLAGEIGSRVLKKGKGKP